MSSSPPNPKALVSDLLNNPTALASTLRTISSTVWSPQQANLDSLRRSAHTHAVAPLDTGPRLRSEPPPPPPSIQAAVVSYLRPNSLTPAPPAKALPKAAATQPSDVAMNDYIAILGRAVDVSSFKKRHPGGAPVLEQLAGLNGTEQFTAGHHKHSSTAVTLTTKFWAGYIVSKLPEDGPPPPLTGVGVYVKDSIATADFPTTFGGVYPDGIPADHPWASNKNAPVVQSLLDAGAVVVGKTACSKACLDVQTPGVSNPWDLTRSPGGSSGGSAVAVAMRWVPLALGSDLAGSLRIPAAWTGISSLRPSRESEVPLDGHMGSPLPFHYALGPMAVSVRMLHAAFQVMSTSTVAPLPPTLIRPSRIAVSPDGLPNVPLDGRISEHIRSSVVTKLKEAGVEVVTSPGPWDTERLKALLKLHQALSSGKAAPSPDEVRACGEARAELDAWLAKERLDAWMLPVTPCLPIKHNLNHDPVTINSEKVDYWKATVAYVTPLSVAGAPVVTLPTGVVQAEDSDDGDVVALPVGMQIVGASDSATLAMGAWMQESSEAPFPPLHRPPIAGSADDAPAAPSPSL